MKTRILVLVCSLFVTVVKADPQLTSWFTTYSGKYARIYTTDANKLAGTTATTWSTGSTSQSSPAYDGVQEVYSSTSWVYIRSTGLGSHVMGPWYLNAAHTQSFPQYPVNSKIIYRIPRTPSIPTTKTKNGGGAIGYFVDGVAMFNSWDAYTWNGSTDAANGGGNVTGYWNRDAYVNEGTSFDPAYAHQPQDGTYHYHADPIALRYLLGDHVDFNSSTKAYTESTSAVTKHSPILGWVSDGYPIYGPYGYSSASNSASGIRRMTSGYVLRNGQSNTVNLTTTGRTTIPQWAVRLYNVSASQSGPNVSTSYPLGRYMEDNDYLGDLGYTQGVNFDLDEYNGRWCVTPEFPNGTYAYFVSINASGTPTYPYNIGRGFYGSPTGGKVTSITETVTTNYLGGPNTALTLNTPSVNTTNDTVTLVWTSVEGGTYKVESSPDQSTWTTKQSSVSSQGISTQTNYTGSAGTGYARVIRTALATFDTAGLAATVTQTATQSYSISDSTPPSITAQPQPQTVLAGATANFSVTASGATPITYLWQKNGTALSDGGNVSGSATTNLTLVGATQSDAASYSVIITNAYGAITSSIVMLTVTAPTVSISPGSQTVQAGVAATFTATATGTGPFTYVWQKNGVTLNDGVTISGSTTTKLSISAATQSDVASYSVIVSNAYGSATSGTTTLAVTAPTVSASPSSQTVQAGASATFTATATGTGTFTYIWQKNGTTLSDGGTISGSTTTRLSINAAMQSDAASYSVIISNAYGSATSGPATLSVTAPTVSVSPSSQNIEAGNSATFAAITTGVAPFTYQWQKNNSPISGATNASFTVSNATTADTGSYSVTASNAYASATSSSALLTVSRDTTAPSVTISSPVANAVVTSSALSVSGSTSDDARITQVSIRVNGGAWQTASLTFGNSFATATWSTSLSLIPQSNLIEVQATDFSGNTSSVASVTVYYQATAPLTLVTNGTGTISGLSSTNLIIGSNYTVKATAASGWLFSNWVSSASGSSSASSYTFTMQSNLVLTANFVLNQFSKLAGTYYGLFSDPANGVSQQTAGFFKVVPTASATYSGFIIVDGDKFTISGKFDVSGSGTSTVTRTGKSTLTVTVQLLFDGSDQITGTVSSATDGWQSIMTGNRSVYSSASVATQYRGRYTMLIPGFVDPSVGPGGDGYMAIVVTNNGTVSASGALGDGVSITAQAATVSKNGDWPLYCTAYPVSSSGHKGSIQGWIHFNGNSANATLAGNLSWNKTSWTNNLYKNGFSANVTAVGSVYQASSARSLFLTNAIFALSGGNLAGALSDTVTISDQNAITFTSANTQSKLTFTPANGRVTGVFSNAMTSTHRATLNGIYLQSTNLNYIGGYFLGTSQSGLMQMQ